MNIMEGLMGNIVISISRLCGCGGSNIARKLATHFGLPLYDRNLLEIISRESGISEDEIAQADEKLLCVAREIKEQGIGADDEFFEYQARILRRLAEDSSYVVLGRCADYVLKDHPNLVRIFITADRRHCIAREADRNGITKKEAAALVDKVNSERAVYYSHYSGSDAWSHPENYDLCINTADFTYDECVDIICKFLEVREQHKKNDLK